MDTQSLNSKYGAPPVGITSPTPTSNPTSFSSLWGKASATKTAENAASPYEIAMGQKNPDGTPNTEKGIIPKMVDTFKEGFQQTKEGVNNPDLFQGLQQIGRGALSEGASLLRIAGSPIEAGLKVVSQLPGFHQALGALQDHVIDPAANKISDSPAIQKFMQSNPHADEVFGNLVSIVSTITGGKIAPEARNVVESAVEGTTSKVKSVVGDVKDVAGNAVNKAKSAVGMGAKTPADLESLAIKDTTPSYNKNLVGEQGIKELDAQGNPTGKITPRVSEVDSKNPFKMRSVNPTLSEVEAGKELSKVQGYDSKASSLDKYNTVTSDIGKKSEAYRASLRSEKVVIPRKEMTAMVKRVVNKTSEDSLLLQKSDPIVKNYIRVAQRAAEKVDGTLEGEDKLRLALDKAYEDAGGKYGNNKGLDQIHRAARDAITEDMAKRAQSTQVKASLKQMSNLYRASDVLKDKAQAEGGSAWEQFKKAHPMITKAGKAVGRAVGIGEAVHLVP